MKKLKILLASNKFYYFLLLITFIYSLIYIINFKPKEIYNINQSEFTLTIKEYKIDGEKLSIEFNEYLVGTYYFKTQEEKENTNLNINDKLYIKGKLNIPSNNTIPNTFNYKKYLFYKNIEYTLSIDEITKIERNKKILYIVKNRIINRLKNINNEYLYAFILGETKYIDEETYNNYKINGITHLFSLSALHVSVFSSILYFVLKKIKLNELISLFVVIAFLIFFSFISSYPPSMLRAVIFFMLRRINNLLKLNIKVINLFYITLITLLLINPNYIFNTGFILSFTITYFILIYSNKNKKTNALKISIISLLSSLPIIINMNNEINIIGFINNLLFIPFVSYVIFPLTLLTFIIQKLTILLNPLTNVMEILSNISSSLLNINLIFKTLTSIEIFIYYLILLLAITKYKKLIFLLITFIFYIQIKPIISNDINVYFLDIGQGDSTLITQKNKSILIDTGGIIEYEKEPWRKRKKEYYNINNIIKLIKSIGLKKIDYLILTHGDYDHMGEAIKLVENFKVEEVIFNCGTYNDLEKELIKVLDEKKIKYYSCIKKLNLKQNKLYFLQTKEYDNENDNSNVIYTDINGYKFLFMGDVSVTTEKEILKEYNLPDIDVLKVGHHGSKTSSDIEFINEINPKYSIISVGKNNRYGHPNKEVLENLQESKIYRTDQDGSIMFKIKKNKLDIETCTP